MSSNHSCRKRALFGRQVFLLANFSFRKSHNLKCFDDKRSETTDGDISTVISPSVGWNPAARKRPISTFIRVYLETRSFHFGPFLLCINFQYTCENVLSSPLSSGHFKTNEIELSTERCENLQSDRSVPKTWIAWL